jgi:hypothetical protein
MWAFKLIALLESDPISRWPLFPASHLLLWDPAIQRSFKRQSAIRYKAGVAARTKVRQDFPNRMNGASTQR